MSDLRATQAVLIGATHSAFLPAVPIVEQNLRLLGAAVTQEGGWGVPEENCTYLLDPPERTVVIAAISDAMKRLPAGGLLLLYVTGNVLSSPDKRSAQFGLSGGRTSAIHLRTIGEVLAETPGTTALIIFDLCVSDEVDVDQVGDTIIALSGARAAAVWTATSPPTEFSAPSADCSPFTARLVDVVHRGLLGGSSILNSEAVYRSLVTALQDRTGVQLRRSAVGPPIPLGASAVTDPPAAPWVVAGFAGEVTTGPELLGIDKDALALAVLLGSVSLQPPLALGVHGEWGSGKTFFMHVLERHLWKLADSGSTGTYCRRILPIWFNAWHYAEGNLWASLLHQIISSLHEQPDAPQRRYDAALREVQGVQEVARRAEDALNLAKTEATSAQHVLTGLRQEQQEARHDAARLQGQDLWATAVDQDVVDGLNGAAAKLGLPPAAATARDTLRVAAEVRAGLADNRQLATAGRFSPLILAIALGLVLSVLGVVIAASIDWSRTWLGPTVAVAAQLAAAGGAAAAWVARNAGLARSLLQPSLTAQRHVRERLAELEAQHKQKLAAADSTLAEKNLAVTAAQRAQDEAKAHQSAAQAEFDQLSGRRLLRLYLSDLVHSNEYGRYLSTAALAYRDLKDLHDYLQKAAGEEKESVDRIVLYIDDLDRCGPEAVVRVLEAVHLLLALPLFVVVVGVDAELLARSLRSRHPVLLTGQTDPGGTTLAPTTSAQDYLDKIFQLAYHLPVMAPDRCAALLREAAVSSQPRSRSTDGIPQRAGSDDLAMPERPPAHHEPAEAPEPTEKIAETGTIRDVPVSEMLHLSDAELRTLDVVAPLVGSTPRRAKRFLNVYRVVKARMLIDAEHRDQLADAAGPMSLIVLVALLIGSPAEAAALIRNAAEDPALAFGAWLGQRPALIRPGGDEAEQAVRDLPVRAILAWSPAVSRFVPLPVTADA